MAASGHVECELAVSWDENLLRPSPASMMKQEASGESVPVLPGFGKSMHRWLPAFFSSGPKQAPENRL